MGLAGADHVQPIEVGLLPNGFAALRKVELPVGDGQLEMLAHFVPGDNLADLLADLGGTERCLGAALNVLLNRPRGRLGGR